MQGIHDRFIPTDVKAHYLQILLRVGFDRLDFGSFVSPKAIPQLRDTAAVLDRLDTAGTRTKLLAIVANVRGVEEAIRYPGVGIVGFPFSVSETFQLRNANSSIAQALATVKRMADLCHGQGKIPLVYLSMAFGNPYGDLWSPEIVADHTARLVDIGIRHIALADTVGGSTPGAITALYAAIGTAFPAVELGLHLHSTPLESRAKLTAALDAGCARFDTALRGFGGCPMAADELTGNIATETLLHVLDERHIETGLDLDAWDEAMRYSREVF